MGGVGTAGLAPGGGRGANSERLALRFLDVGPVGASVVDDALEHSVRNQPSRVTGENGIKCLAGSRGAARSVGVLGWTHSDLAFPESTRNVSHIRSPYYVSASAAASRRARKYTKGRRESVLRPGCRAQLGEGFDLDLISSAFGVRSSSAYVGVAHRCGAGCRAGVVRGWRDDVLETGRHLVAFPDPLTEAGSRGGAKALVAAPFGIASLDPGPGRALSATSDAPHSHDLVKFLAPQ